MRRGIPFAAVVVGAACLAAPPARAEDLAATVAKARDQVENGSYADALRTLATLQKKQLPPALQIEAALLETTSLLVTKDAAAGSAACEKAVVAANYDPEVARDQSPKVREACRAAARKVRGGRLASEGVAIGDLEIHDPEVAYQPVRISTTVGHRPAWLKVVARITSPELDGAVDLPLVPSDEGPLLGTLDASWLRPRAKLKVDLVAQDAFGDLGGSIHEHDLPVPAAESMIRLDEVPKGAKVTLDDAVVVPDADGRLATTAGKHDVTLTVPSGATASSSVELAKGTVTRVALSPQQPSPSRVLPWIATGTSAALVAAGAGLLINAQARRSELEDAAKAREPGTDLPATDYATLKSIDDERKTFTNVGIGLLAGAGATAVVATVLWLVPTGKRRASASAPPITVVAGPTFAGVAGSF